MRLAPATLAGAMLTDRLAAAAVLHRVPDTLLREENVIANMVK
jgi:hypothetical protein